MAAEISGMNDLAASSRIVGYDKKIQMRATLRDFYVNHQGLYNAKDQAIPDAIYMKIGESGNVSNRSIVVTMKLPLTGTVVTGNTRALGTEKDLTTKHGTVYRNNYKYVVKTEQYNTRKLDQEAYGLYDQHVKDLGPHARQFEGKAIRQALLLKYATFMDAGDLSGVITQRWNPHVFVQGATDANQPVYDSTESDWVDNIATAIESVSGALATQNQAGAANFRMVGRIALRALDKKIKPIVINGEDAYVLSVSPLSGQIFTDPTLANSFGSVWTDIARLNAEKKQTWSGLIGAYKSPSGVTIYITVDQKLPSILPAGAGPYTLTAGFVDEGDVDSRSYSNASTRDVGVLHGQGALVKYDPEKLHMREHLDDYDRIKGVGYFGVSGIQRLEFDQESPDDTSNEYYGSMLCIMNRWAYT